VVVAPLGEEVLEDETLACPIDDDIINPAAADAATAAAACSLIFI